VQTDGVMDEARESRIANGSVLRALAWVAAILLVVLAASTIVVGLLGLALLATSRDRELGVVILLVGLLFLVPAIVWVRWLRRPTREGDEWIRSRGQSIILRILGLIVVVFGILLALGSASLPNATGWARLGVAVVWASFAGSGLFVLHASRSGCRPESGGLRVRGPFKSFLIEWNEIETVSLGRCGLWPYVARLHLRDGGIVPVWGIQAPNIAPRNRWTAGLIAHLQAEVNARTGTMRSTGDTSPNPSPLSKYETDGRLP
jgi:PH (Pleckstrin Homology) domain-containing protein